MKLGVALPIVDIGGEPASLREFAQAAEEIGYHAHLMMQEGLIKGMDVTHTGSPGPEAVPTGLTWKGHEFLDLARDQDRWNRAKAIIATVGGAPISVWIKVLTDLMLQGVETATIKSS